MHHANIILSKEDGRDSVFDVLIKNLNFNVLANPDFLLIEGEPFGIDEARDLEQWAIGKPLTGDIKVCLIVTKTITFEAQNALLKVLEEPPAGTYIFINLENLGGLLPTVISRVMVLDGASDSETLGYLKDNNILKFLNSNIRDRLTIVLSLAKKEDKNVMKEFIKNLEEIAYKENVSANQMKNILTAKIFARARGSSPKMLLEWLSGVL